jgi:hypothetical protein
MKIREGAYYRTRGGDVVGPMQFRDHATDPWHTNLSTWREGGRIWCGNGWHDLDLISEVYVSDTPPGLTATTITNGLPYAMPETKTLRDEFAIAIVAAFLSRPLSDNELTLEQCQIVWDNADAMMEARKK